MMLIGIVLCFSFCSSMTTLADINNKWAAYAGPGGWNGRNVIMSEGVDFSVCL